MALPHERGASGRSGQGSGAKAESCVLEATPGAGFPRGRLDEELVYSDARPVIVAWRSRPPPREHW